MRLESTEMGGTPPGAWGEGWIVREGSVELEYGSGLAARVRAGGVRGRCKEETWAWCRPGWRTAEEEDSSDQSWDIYRYL